MSTGLDRRAIAEMLNHVFMAHMHTEWKFAASIYGHIYRLILYKPHTYQVATGKQIPSSSAPLVFGNFSVQKIYWKAWQ